MALIDPATLATPVIPASRFNWHKGIATTELSEFRGYEHVFFGRLYDDACDVGFRIISDKTRRVEAFYLDRTDKDHTGEDTYGWHFLPIDPDLRETGVKVLVIND